ncbi:unnamed protein product [Acidithrix sp. C25]|nr:unnamed protein product [Acidithrix sp. C25]
MPSIAHKTYTPYGCTCGSIPQKSSIATYKTLMGGVMASLLVLVM